MQDLSDHANWDRSDESRTLPTWVEIEQAMLGHVDQGLNETLRRRLDEYKPPVPARTASDQRHERGCGGDSHGPQTAPLPGQEDWLRSHPLPDLLADSTVHRHDDDVGDGPAKRERRGLQPAPELDASPLQSIPEEAFRDLQRLLHEDFTQSDDEVRCRVPQPTTLYGYACACSCVDESDCHRCVTF